MAELYGVAGLFGIITFYVSVILLLIQKPRKDAAKETNLKSSYVTKSVEYSNDLMKSIRSIIGEIAVIKFRTFIDGVEINKVTKEHTKPVVDEVANAAHKYLEFDHINFDLLLYTPEFIDQYIIDISVLAIKDLLAKYVEQTIHEE